MFTRFIFRNFRGFESLDLDGLKRVNLIVGKNNAGKTSFLEGVTAVAAPGMLGQMPGLFRANVGSVAERYFRWLVRDAAGVEESRLEGKSTQGDHLLVLQRTERRKTKSYPGHTTVISQQGFSASHPTGQESFEVRALSVQHRDPQKMVATFAEAIRSRDGKNSLENLLKSVDERIHEVRLDYTGNNTFIVVDIGLSQLVPLAQAGQGIYRLVTIFSELLGETPKICFIDEVENGIHHTALGQLWTGLAEVSERLDIQLFATTHSHECLEAAHGAFAVRSSYDLSVIQLFRLKDKTDGRVLDRELIEAAIQGSIDLR